MNKQQLLDYLKQSSQVDISTTPTFTFLKILKLEFEKKTNLSKKTIEDIINNLNVNFSGLNYPTSEEDNLYFKDISNFLVETICNIYEATINEFGEKQFNKIISQFNLKL